MNVILVTAVFIIFFVYLINQIKRPWNYPPGPRWFPYIGNTLQLRKLARSLGGIHMAFFALARKYKTEIVGMKVGYEYAVCVSEHSLIREVLIRDDFEGRPENFFFKMRSLGRPKSGITGSDGTVWSTNRNFTIRHLRSVGFGKLPMEMLIKNATKEFLSTFENNNSGIQVGKFFSPIVMNILWTLASGDNISGNDKFFDELLDLMVQRGKCFDITGGILNQYPWLRHIAPGWSGYNLIVEINQKFKNIIGGSIQRHYGTWEEGKNDDLIYCYISEIKKAEPGSVFCDEELAVVCLDLFIAGTQTTSGTLDLLFYMMIQESEVQRKVQEEIDEKIPKDAILQYQDLEKLPYVAATLLENYRFRYILPVIGPRRAMKDTTLAGYNIPKDATIYIDVHAMHHSKDYVKPELFQPERFLDDSGCLLPQAENLIVPFGLGKRRCPGEVLAKHCIFYFFVETMRNFNVSFSEKSESLNEKFATGITTFARNYRAKFSKR